MIQLKMSIQKPKKAVEKEMTTPLAAVLAGVATQ